MATAKSFSFLDTNEARTPLQSSTTDNSQLFTAIDHDDEADIEMPPTFSAALMTTQAATGPGTTTTVSASTASTSGTSIPSSSGSTITASTTSANSTILTNSTVSSTSLASVTGATNTNATTSSSTTCTSAANTTSASAPGTMTATSAAGGQNIIMYAIAAVIAWVFYALFK